MSKPAILATSVSLVLCAAFLGQQNPGAPDPTQRLQPGVVDAHVTCAAKPEQSYALYLPSHYAPDKRWPIIYAFDPAARGNLPVELMKDAAERYGYIVVASNNSRNGPWTPEAEAMQSMADDTQTRFSLDRQRVYFAGFSGGARVASQIAQNCKCAAGVLLNGAGFAIGSTPSPEVKFAVFAAVGIFDFNYPEVTQLGEKLDASGIPHVLRYFDGPHQWAPATVMDEALAWFRLVEMKQAREPRDDSFVAAQRTAGLERAGAFEQSGDLYSAWREYRQAAATFDGLADNTAFRQKLESLGNQKLVREGARREKRDFDDQGALTEEISSGLAAIREASTSRSDTVQQTGQRIDALRSRATHEKHPERERVLRRALGGILVSAMEMGQERLAAKDLAAAEAYFNFGAIADPDSVWALSNLAVARAMEGNRKGTLEALRRAKEKTKDSAAFLEWFAQEPAFTRLQNDPQFRALLAAPQPQK